MNYFDKYIQIILKAINSREHRKSATNSSNHFLLLVSLQIPRVLKRKEK